MWHRIATVHNLSTADSELGCVYQEFSSGYPDTRLGYAELSPECPELNSAYSDLGPGIPRLEM